MKVYIVSEGVKYEYERVDSGFFYEKDAEKKILDSIDLYISERIRLGSGIDRYCSFDKEEELTFEGLRQVRYTNPSDYWLITEIELQ